MWFISRVLMIVFAALILLQFVATNLPPKLEFESNFINELTPPTIEESLLETTVTPLETTPYKILSRGTFDLKPMIVQWSYDVFSILYV